MSAANPSLLDTEGSLPLGATRCEHPRKTSYETRLLARLAEKAYNSGTESAPYNKERPLDPAVVDYRLEQVLARTITLPVCSVQDLNARTKACHTANDRFRTITELIAKIQNSAEEGKVALVVSYEYVCYIPSHQTSMPPEADQA